MIGICHNIPDLLDLKQTNHSNVLNYIVFHLDCHGINSTATMSVVPTELPASIMQQMPEA